MSKGVIPTAEDTQSILTQLLGIDVTVSNVTGDFLGDGYVAEYISQDSEALALCIADNGMVVLAGSAFLNTSSSDAHAMLVSGEIQANVLQSYHEIANILTRVISDNDGTHMKLGDVHPPGSTSGSQIEKENFGANTSFYIDIPMYGTGMLTFYV